MSRAAIGTPAIRRRLVGAALRRYRESTGLSLQDAACTLERDRSTISRIETGQRGIRVRDLRDLLAEYDVGEHEQAFLTAIASPKATAGWWQGYPDVLGEGQRDLMIMEALATQVRAYHTQRIPELLQTEQYADAIASTSGLTAEARQRAVEATRARQDAILGAEHPGLSVIITEAALCQQVAGADVMRAQLARLVGVADASPRLTLQVVPFAANAHPTLDLGGLTILTFGQAAHLGVVHLPGICGGIYLEHDDDVARYTAAFTQIRQAALTRPASAAMLRRMAAG
jgi:transcriptional regulator with XRE-family HTH domain